MLVYADLNFNMISQKFDNFRRFDEGGYTARHGLGIIRGFINLLLIDIYFKRSSQ